MGGKTDIFFSEIKPETASVSPWIGAERKCWHYLPIAETETSTAGQGIEYKENGRTVD
jgi:hypothetical protein